MIPRASETFRKLPDETFEIGCDGDTFPGDVLLLRGTTTWFKSPAPCDSALPSQDDCMVLKMLEIPVAKDVRVAVELFRIMPCSGVATGVHSLSGRLEGCCAAGLVASGGVVPM